MTWEQRLDSLTVRLFADTADPQLIRRLAKLPYIKGFTTNPTLMRQAGVTDYKAYAKFVLAKIPDLPVSFEVPKVVDIEDQARIISTWGNNVYVKVPIVGVSGVSNCGVIRQLAANGVKINVTAVCTLAQVAGAAAALKGGAPSIVSVFVGRIADTGHDPLPFMKSAVQIARQCPSVELLWASTRQLLDIFHADRVGCDIITVTPAIINKLPLIGTDLKERSMQTVIQFCEDAVKVGYSL